MANEKNLKNLVIGLSVVVVLLIGGLIWVMVTKQKTVETVEVITTEKDQLTEQMVQLKQEYETLTSDNDTLNKQLAVERKKVDLLLEKIKKTDASNTSKLRQYEKEIRGLKSILKGYIRQIDSLNTENLSLKKDVATAKQESNQAKMKNTELQASVDEYAKKVEKGSALKARSIILSGLNSSDKETQRSGRVAKLRACFTLLENPIAQTGPRTLYIRLKGPDGILMSSDPGNIFNVRGEQLTYSAAREVDYQGEELDVCIYFNGGNSYVKGIYTVDVYSSQGVMGSAQLILR